jgi:hypothetical protein
LSLANKNIIHKSTQLKEVNCYNNCKIAKQAKERYNIASRAVGLGNIKGLGKSMIKVGEQMTESTFLILDIDRIGKEVYEILMTYKNVIQSIIRTEVFIGWHS